MANCDIYILFVVTEHQGDKRKDYMSLEVVPEDESKETEVMEEDEQTKVNHLNPVSIKFCTFIFLSQRSQVCESLCESLIVNIIMSLNKSTMMKRVIYFAFLLFAKAEDVQKQVNHEGRGTEEHRGDKLEDCCCQCTSLSF